MVVSDAVRKAKDAALQYAGAAVGVRVEEVEQLETSWHITLSWLEENTEARIRRDADPLKGMLKGIRAFTEPPPMERVYRVFVIRDEQPVRMTRARDP
jgi:hypothetical protein